VNVKRMTSQLTKFFSNIESTLELAETLYAQVKRRPPEMETNVRLIGIW
jgi:hypothetical protein